MMYILTLLRLLMKAKINNYLQKNRSGGQKMINFDYLLREDQKQPEQQLGANKEEEGKKQAEAQNVLPPTFQQYDETFTEEDKALIDAFMKTEAMFVPPPINDHITNNAYRSCFEKTVETIADNYTMFGQKYDLKKNMKLKPSRTINANLRGDLKISVYQLFNQLLDTFSKLSKDNREGANFNFKKTVIPFIKKFIRDIQELKLYYIRRQIMAKIEQQISLLKKETEEIDDVLDEMNKYVENNCEKSVDEGNVVYPNWAGSKDQQWDNVLN